MKPRKHEESEEPNELRHDEIGDVVEDTFENVEYQKPCRWPTVAERWKEREVGVHYYVQGRYVGEDESRYYCAVFERAEVGFVAEVNSGDRVFSAERETVVHCTDEGENPVPVKAGEFVEDSERVPPYVVPAVVRLQTLDKCLCPRRHVRNSDKPASTGRLAGPPVPLEVDGGVGRDGESGTGRRLPILIPLGKPAYSELPNEVVEGGAHVLQTVPDNKAPNSRRVLDDMNRVDKLSSVRLSIAGNSVRLTVPEGLDFVLEDRQVLVCPRELEPNPFKLVW